VLEIGAGTGYNAALLACLVGTAGRVTTMDIDDDIGAAARTHLNAAGVTGVRVVCADGWAGDAEDGPYDRIVLTVGSHDISPAWRAQLAPGGRLLLPLSLRAVQASIAFDNRDDWLESASVYGCQFMRLRGTAGVPISGVAIGPEPAPIVWPRGTHVVDGSAVHTLLRTAGEHLATGLLVPEDDLHDGLVAWLGLHEPTSAWLTARGKAVASGLVPTLFRNGDEWVSTFGFFESDGLALFTRAAPTSDAAADGVAIDIRTHGNQNVGERLRAAALGWDEAGRPTFARLRVRAYPIEYPYHTEAPETVLTRPYTRFVLDWSP
jgi:protein-L-isoaspartate(D-aspartate) O-methyltransferase